MCSEEYLIEGKFPSRRILGIGPRRRSLTTLVTVPELMGNRHEDQFPYEWRGELEVKGKDIKGKIIFERGTGGEPFRTEGELLDFLKKKYSVTYLRNKRYPAVSTGG